VNLHDHDIERSYLACCLDMPAALDAGLPVEALASPTHRVVMATLIAIRQGGEPYDDTTVVHHLERRGVERAKAIDVMMGIRSAPARGVRAVVPVIRKLHDLRSLHEAATLGAMAAQEGDSEKAREALAKAAFGGHSVLEVFTLNDAMVKAAEVFAEADAARRKGGGSSFVSLGLCPTIDRLLTVGPGDTVLIGAETNVGKSSLTMTMVLDFERRGIPAGFISIEDPQEDWGAKAIGSYGQVDTGKFWAGNANQEDWRLLAAGMGETKKPTVCKGVVAKSAKLEEVTEAMCALVRVHGVKILFLDYLQAVESPQRHATPKQQIENVYATAQATARMLGVPLVANSQLSRGDDNTREPTIKRFKESGRLEFGAQVALLFWVDPDDNTEDEPWLKIRGKVAKLKRTPRRPVWQMVRTHGGVLREVDGWAPTKPEPRQSTRGVRRGF
jgi:replicative DNA helicase